MIIKSILDLSIELHISYAKALQEVEEILTSGAADSLEEAFLILHESEGFEESNAISSAL